MLLETDFSSENFPFIRYWFIYHIICGMISFFVKKHFSDVPSGRLKEPSKLEFVKFSWFLGSSRSHLDGSTKETDIKMVSLKKSILVTVNVSFVLINKPCSENWDHIT